MNVVCGWRLAKNCKGNCGVLLITYGIFLWIKPCAVWNSFCFSRILSNFSIKVISPRCGGLG